MPYIEIILIFKFYSIYLNIITSSSLLSILDHWRTNPNPSPNKENKESQQSQQGRLIPLLQPNTSLTRLVLPDTFYISLWENVVLGKYSTNFHSKRFLSGGGQGTILRVGLGCVTQQSPQSPPNPTHTKLNLWQIMWSNTLLLPTESGLSYNPQLNESNQPTSLLPTRTLDYRAMSSGVILAGLGMAAVGFGGRYIARTMPQLAQKMEVIKK